jgi:TonB family protein
MTFPADAALRSGLLILAGLIASACLRRQSAAHRHVVLAAAILGAAAVGPLASIVPAWGLEVGVPAVPQPRAALPLVDAAVVAAAVPSQSIPLAGIIAIVWFAGCGVWLGLLLAGLFRLQRTSSRARPIHDAQCLAILHDVSASAGLRRSPELLCAATLDSPATFGVLRHRVLLPAEARRWSAGRLRVVLRHEVAHVRRHDWLLQMCAEILRSINWFNPFVWIACARLRRESEQACDDEVLGMGVPSHQYAAELLALVRTSRRMTAGVRSMAPAAAPSTLERRIAAMLNPSVSRSAPSRAAVAIATVAVLAIVLPAAGLRAAQTSPLPLEGFVYDASGAVLPQVAVTLADAHGKTTSSETDATGHFEFASVAPGAYVLGASVPGFRALRQNIQLRNARDWDRAIMLQVGELTETIHVSATRTGAAQAAAQPPVPVRVGGNIRAPRKVKDVHPVYPQSMRDAGREGIVPMEAIIDRSGAVQSVRVLSADIHPDFAVAAADAVRQWQFEPTLLNGKPVEVRMAVTVRFSLED